MGRPADRGISAGSRFRPSRCRDRTEWTGPARGAGAPLPEAASRDTVRNGIARPLPRTHRARTAAHHARRKSSRGRIDKTARRWRCASLPTVISVGPSAALRHSRTHGDQPDAAVRAKSGLLPARRRVTVFRACRNGMTGIHRPAALGTVANGRITAPMVEIWTGCAHRPGHAPTISRNRPAWVSRCAQAGVLARAMLWVSGVGGRHPGSGVAEVRVRDERS